MAIHRPRDDHPNPWRIQVRGHPARVRGNRWKKAIRAAVMATYPGQTPFAPPPEGTKYTVEVVFRMTPEDLARRACDLDNFAKPVLDTLFTSQNVSPEVTGVLLPVNDTWVFRLVLKKIGVKTPEKQGADIKVTCHPMTDAELISRCEAGHQDACAELDRRGVEPPIIETGPDPIQDPANRAP